MAKLLKLRFLDVSDKDKPTFVTLFCDGEHKGYFKRENKDVVDGSAEGTTCRPQKKLLTEVRTLGNAWRQVEEAKFKSLLRDVNKLRIDKGWDTVELPVVEDADKS